MHNPINGIEAFLKYTAERKLWVYAAVLFMTCLAFTYNFILAYPSKSAAFERSSLEFKESAQERARLDRAYGLLGEALQAFSSSLAVYHEVRVTLVEKRLVAQELLNDAISKTADSIRTITIAVATMKGMRFEEEGYASFVKYSIDELSKCAQVLTTIKNLYSATLEKNIEDMKKHGKELKSYIAKQPGYDTLEGVENYQAHFDAIYERLLIKVNEETGNVIIFRVQECLAVLSGMYIVGFILVAFRSWMKRGAKNSPSSEQNQ